MSRELINYQTELSAMEAIADYASKTKWFEALGGKPGMTMIALYARELDLPVLQCLFGGMKSVLGKIEISPVMMNAMIRKAGHSLQTVEHTLDKCVLKGKRKDTGEEMEVSFSIEDAKRARIYKGAWETYPKNMTYKTCLSNLGKWLFPDVIGASFVEGEIDEDFNKKPEKQHRQMEPTIIVDAEPDFEELEALPKLLELCKDFDPPGLLIKAFIEEKKGEMSEGKFALRCLNGADKFIEFFHKWAKDKRKEIEEQVTE